MTLPLWVVIGVSLPVVVFGVHYFRLARQSGTFAALMMVLCVVYGIALERFGVRTTQAYEYNKLLVMVGASPHWVPVVVGIIWSCIIFLTMRMSDRLALPLWQRPLFDGMLGVIIDVVMDPVSSASIWRAAGDAVTMCIGSGPPWGGVGLWVWCFPQGYNQLWYNVPYANFAGWFFVVAVMSAVIRLARIRFNPDGRSLVVQTIIGLAGTVIAVAITKVCVNGSLWAIREGLISSQLLFVLVAAGPLVFAALSWKTIHMKNPVDWAGIGFPLFIFLVEPLSYVALHMNPSGWPLQPLMLAATAVGGLAVFLLPSWSTIRGARGPADLPAAPAT